MKNEEGGRPPPLTIPVQSPPMPFLLASYAFALGAIIGSFLNVVIYRYPREQSVVYPPSRCPRCGASIRWFDNVPVLSWILLFGRCRDCRSSIDVRYPLVELANGLFYLAIFLHSGISIMSLLLAASVSATIVLIFIDAEIQMLPDVIDLPGIAVGLLVGVVAHSHPATGLVTSGNLLDSVVGAIAGAAILLSVAFLYRVIRRVEGMGLGDVKMLAMIGSIVGWQWLFAVLMIASVSGSIVGVAIIVSTGSDFKLALPFGVFLGLGLLTVLFFGDILSSWLPAFRLMI